MKKSLWMVLLLAGWLIPVSGQVSVFDNYTRGGPRS